MGCLPKDIDLVEFCQNFQNLQNLRFWPFLGGPLRGPTGLCGSCPRRGHWPFCIDFGGVHLCSLLGVLPHIDFQAFFDFRTFAENLRSSRSIGPIGIYWFFGV